MVDAVAVVYGVVVPSADAAGARTKTTLHTHKPDKRKHLFGTAPKNGRRERLVKAVAAVYPLCKMHLAALGNRNYD